ncbi:RNA-binding protein MEX3B isoform X1 [Drosophila serrata]|uniref:RNA-binding protein MEX3B isoform X1 n=1 Tax=Drosophila serrata TaxID=7274 RepID=UPI000A1CFFCB|nr:RNA-binding protein MEX3B isoform X1 [Drosophila serrata]XP_020809893.1 RNA-binding protein MEX3B isoform X1 [Drosophila serrata]
MSSVQVVSKILNNMNTKMNPVHHLMAEQQPKVLHTSSTVPISLSEDPRTLQLALELSLVGLNDNQTCYAQQQSAQPLAAVQSDYEMGNINSKSDNANMPLTSSSSSCFLLPTAMGTGATGTGTLEDRSKKSQNMTECVPVPSSEHVAEIVGRQGCKIKALRAKTNTYIKTPVRGEEPVFVVTGRKEDVSKAKREILSAADHFSLIRASRKPMTADGHTSSGEGGVTVGGCINGSGSGSSSSSGIGAVPRLQSGPPCMPGQITIQVRVPYRVVGLVVGPKGATIKHIQQETQTYIVTPSREKEPIFEVTGLPDNVDTARKQIEAHIALRTGVGLGTGTGSSSFPVLGSESSSIVESNDFINSSTINSLTQILNDDLNTELLTSIYKNVHPDYVHNSINQMKPIIQNYQLNNCYKKRENISDFELTPTLTASSIPAGKQHHQLLETETKAENCVFRNTNKALPSSTLAASTLNHSNPTTTNNIITRSCSSASSTTSTKSTNNSTNANTPPEILNIWKKLNDSIDVDEGIGDSPNIWTQTANMVLSTDHHHQCSPTNSISPTDSLLEQQTIVHNTSRESNQQQMVQAQAQSQAQTPAQTAIQPFQPSNAEKFVMHRECCVCNENQVTTALVPCGHNMFCMECANQICVSVEAVCPICNSIVYHAMRILG